MSSSNNNNNSNKCCTTSLYGVWGSPNVQRALFTMYLKEAKIDLQFVSFKSGDHKKPDYLAKNPHGQVPLLTDGEFHLTESRAIARYINDKYDSGVNLSPDDNIKSRAVFEQWNSIETTQITPELQNIGYQRFFVPFFLKGTPDESVIAAAVKKVEPLLDLFDKHLQGKDYVLGSRITLSDVFFAPFFHKISNTPEKYLIEKRSNVASWWKRVSSTPAWQKVAALENV
jgi:glutathione S-transferase